jgi:hypothetical protein
MRARATSYGSTQLSPEGDALLKAGSGRGDIAVGQLHGALRHGRAGPEGLRPETSSDLSELVRRPASFRRIASGDGDLHLRRQERSALPVGAGGLLARRDARRALEGLPDRSDRRVHVALGKPEQRVPGLGIPPQLVGLVVGLLGPGQVPQPQPDLAELGERPARLSSEVGPRLLARESSLLLGLAT